MVYTLPSLLRCVQWWVYALASQRCVQRCIRLPYVPQGVPTVVYMPPYVPHGVPTVVYMPPYVPQGVPGWVSLSMYLRVCTTVGIPSYVPQGVPQS